MPRLPFQRHRGAWRRFRDRNDRRHVAPDWIEDGQIHPEFYDAVARRMAHIAGFGIALYIGFSIHLIAGWLALSVSFGIAAGVAWKSGLVPALFFGRGWRTVRRSEEADLFWLNVGVLCLGSAGFAVATGWAALEAVASAA